MGAVRRFAALGLLAATVGAASAQTAALRYASVGVKEAYYLSGDYAGLRSVLKTDQRIADVPTVRVFGEAKPERPRDLVLILDELAELHTYFDPHQDQAFALSRRIRGLLDGDLGNASPGYATRLSFLSQLPRGDDAEYPALNAADLQLLRERIDRRERYFGERLLAQRPETTALTVTELASAWNDLPAEASARHRLALARRLANAATSAAAAKESIAPLIPVLGGLAADPALTARERIEASLLAAYFDALAGNAAQVVARYGSVPARVAHDIEAEQVRRRERAERFESLVRQNREYLEKKQLGATATSFLVSLATMAVATKIGAVKTPKQAQDFGQSLGNSMATLNEGIGRESHRVTWTSSAVATDLNRELATLRVLHRYIDIPLILELMPPLIDSHAAQGRQAEVLAMADIYFDYANAIRGSTRDAVSRESFQAKMGRVFVAAATAAFALDRAERLLELSERYSSHVLLDAIVGGRSRAVGGAADAGSREALANFTRLADARTLGAEEIVDYLKRRDMALARLFEMNGRLGLLLADRDGVRLVSVPVSAAEMAALPQSVRKVAASDAGGRAQMRAAIEGNPAGRFLASHLFADDKPLMLIPSTGLADFPFAALTDVGGAASAYLIERRPLVRHLSASIASAIGSREARRQEGFVSLGDPVLVKEFVGQERLPAAARESLDAARLMGGRAYVAEEATQEVLLSALRDSGTVHVAAHGLFNKDEPLDSRLVVPSADRQSGGLSAFRLYGQGIRATTVLLNACSLARDSITQGNEVNGFIRPLLMQSTRNVVSNLWEVNDDGAYAVNMAILRRLHAGRDIALAFREGIAEVIGDPRYASPYYWAPFVLFAAR